MQLQNFVTEVIETMGGVVEPVEYALCEVLIPDAYKSYFQNKTEIELAFDYEVAQENPNSEFVTFGSYILEQILTIANEKPVSSIRYAEVERQTPGNPEKKINEFLQDDRARVNIINESHVMGIWAVFQFHVTFISDEKEESSEQVWVNLLTGEISEEMQQIQNSIIYISEPLYNYPIPSDINIEEAYHTAYGHVDLQSEKMLESRKQDPQLQKDLDRIESYYRELRVENDKRMKRKGLSEDKIKEIAAKSNAIGIEMEKQMEEIRNKYTGQIDIAIDHGILYFVPLVQYDVEVHYRSEQKEQTLYYNPLTKQMEGQGVRSIVPTKVGQ
jgi:hypothetical protein